MRNIEAIRRDMRNMRNSMTGSDQTAVEYAIQFMESNYGLNAYRCDDDDLAYFAQYGCRRANEGNVEPEYIDEDFYEDEADLDSVVEYLRLRREFELAQNSETTPYL